MELLLIRHALPVRRELTEGVADPELSEAGVAQALHLAEYLASEELHAIYASPLKRAQQTAAPIAERFQLEVTLVDGVAEFDRNSSEYVPVEELKATNDPRWQELIDNRWDGRDETQEQFTDRVFNAMEAIIEAHTGHNVAVVCHGGVINSYLARILGTAETAGFFYPNYTSIHRVVAARTGQRQIITINETAHLRGTGLPIGLYGK
ncbi:MAG: histidine phosphatase family protein [Actinomycetota bacterium]|jgi:probable phosphoglycerate mutase